MPERAEKLSRLRAVMALRGVTAAHLARADSVAWFTGGARVYVDTSSERGVGSILVTPTASYLLTDNIEAPRLVAEEPLGGFSVVAPEWHAAVRPIDALTAGLVLGSDVPGGGGVGLSADLVSLRAPLTAEEVVRYRALGADLGAAMMGIATGVVPGMTEHQVAGLVARAVYAIGAVPVVVLVAADERLLAHRHPLPTDHAVRDALMWVVCARRHGLIANLTRLVSFGPAADALRRRMAAVAHVEAVAHAATRPGALAGDIFAAMQQAYASVGFPEAWRQHHQGGACSYGARDWIARPDSTERVHAQQAFAWNPSVPGAKSEDTILCTEAGIEVLTRTAGWPQLEVSVGGRTVAGNDVLVR